MKQPAWLKPNDVESLKGEQTECVEQVGNVWWCKQQKILCFYAGGRWWSFGNDVNWRRTIINDNIQRIVTFVEYESVTDFKDFKALHNIVLDIDNQLLCSDIQTEAGQMYDELWRSFEMF